MKNFYNSALKEVRGKSWSTKLTQEEAQVINELPPEQRVAVVNIVLRLQHDNFANEDLAVLNTLKFVKEKIQWFLHENF